MKQIMFCVLASLLASALTAQLENDNTMTATINGEEFVTQPRRITIGNYTYVTGNLIGPDKSLRIWMGSWDGTDIWESGTYLIVGDDYVAGKKKNETWPTDNYKGIAIIRYVEETKTPRLEYHMGDSRYNDESLVAVIGDDGYVELSFNATLNGSWWKERTSATVFGGVDRLVDKMEDKAVTKATGYDQDMDPEGWGYKRQKQTDEITITGCSVRLKMN
jgi:hypothetical protein